MIHLNKYQTITIWERITQLLDFPIFQVASFKNKLSRIIYFYGAESVRNGFSYVFECFLDRSEQFLFVCGLKSAKKKALFEGMTSGSFDP